MNQQDRVRGRVQIWRSVGLAVAMSSACAGPVERSTLADLRAVESILADPPPTLDGSADEPSLPAFDGLVPAYLAYAFERSPSLRATFEDWRAATFRPAQERRLPEPTITYAGFISSVETRVGPQRHRLGAQQWFPWPSRLTAGGQAASLEAQAAQRRFEAHALEIAAEVHSAYWALWRVHRQREVLQDAVEILRSLSAQVRTRIEVGAADLADLAQIDLMLSRDRDRLAGLDEAQRVAEARLVRVLGAPDGTSTPVSSGSPRVAELDESVEALTAEAAQHPQVETLAKLSDAAQQRVREARADRFPSFGIGVDWIITGQSPATMPPPDSGKDAVAVSLSLKVPLWGRAYGAGENEARARGAALRARAIDARNATTADVRAQIARLNDDIRRVRVYQTTLIPQAETTLESVLGSYSAGRSSVAELLWAERELIGLQDELYAVEADYGARLANLERAVGRPVRTKGQIDEDR